MIAILLSIPVLGTVVILQSAVFSKIPLLHGTADLMMLALIAWALQRRVESAWHWCIIGGLSISFVSGLPYGVPLIGYLFSVGLALLLRRRVWQMPILAMFITTFFGTILSQALAMVVLLVGGTSLPILESLNLITLPSLVLNIILAVPMFVLMGDLAKLVYPEPLEM